MPRITIVILIYHRHGPIGIIYIINVLIVYLMEWQHYSFFGGGG
jgi:hypothetical protein